MKKRNNTEDFCTEFYNQAIFAEIAGVDPWETYCEVSYKQIVEADPAFEQVDFSAYVYELRALRLEVFCIAWWCCFYNKDKILLDQSEFTKCFLEERGDADIWESIGNYNHAIARAVTGNHKPNDEAARRAHLNMLNMMRTSLFDRYLELGYDSMIIALVANRFGSTKAWKSKRGHVYLSFELTKQLEYEIKEEARSAILFIIQGFYDGSLEDIKKIKIV